MNMGLVTAPRFCGSNPPHTWVSLHLRISQVLCDRPCALPMVDSFAYRRSIWTFGSRHTDDPYGQTWDVIFAIPSVAPSSNGRPKILLGFNVHLCGSDQKNIFFYYLFFFVWGHVSWFSWLTCCVDYIFQGTATCRLPNGWCRFVDPASRPYK